MFRHLFDWLTAENAGPYINAEELLNTIQFGDIVEFRRKHYSHWGMYCGNESVIHLRNTGEKGVLPRPDENPEETTGSNENNIEKRKEVLIAVVEMRKLEDVANGDKCRVNNLEKMAERWAKREPEMFERRSQEDAVKSARMMLLLEIEFDLWHRNSKHMCTKWKYNI